jgi:hypothetical protein
VGLAAVLVAGGLFASNMGFKLNFLLEGPGTTATGTTLMAMPYNPQTNITNADTLLQDINAVAGSSVVGSVSKWDRSSDGLIFYTGFSGTNFSIVPEESYFITVSTNVNYIVVGSHNPGLGVTFYGPGSTTPDGVSSTGTNSFSYPYHSTLSLAGELIAEVNAVGGGTVASVSTWDKTTDGLIFYTGFSGTNFGLVPGEGYLVTVGGDVTGYVPSHY